MTGNCFVRQEATLEIIKNVASFCAECYSEVQKNQIIFYDMENCCYLCEACQEVLAEKLDANCESLDSKNNSLF
ncbi:MAG: Unknown protein [uncultured Sulfurovum sp.]|uniref:Uncharacterized protein n=1 Tax=uncultured Sulfurovum sp. TaxID=269237 RepID=A0A6S6TV90_9BACT|nr:MAG: Unknown protein [uncultured Sulfurovum sp.]